MRVRASVCVRVCVRVCVYACVLCKSVRVPAAAQGDGALSREEVSAFGKQKERLNQVKYFAGNSFF